MQIRHKFFFRKTMFHAISFLKTKLSTSFFELLPVHNVLLEFVQYIFFQNILRFLKFFHEL